MDRFEFDPHNGNTMTLEKQKQSMLNTLNLLSDYITSHGLRYYLVGGTMIGAVRHGGFIPWDDDIDIAMPLPDLEKLVSLVQNEPVANNIVISAYRSNPDHFWPMAKAFDKNTFLVEPNVTSKYQKIQAKFGGVYVDIFPLYGLPNDEKERKKHCDDIYQLYKSYKRSIRLVKKGTTVKEVIRYYLSTILHIPYRIISPEYFLKKMDEAIHKYDFSTSEYCGFALGICKYPKDVNLISIFSEGTDIQFENLICKAPNKYEEYLENQFGDYMKLPPENQRKIHPRVVYYRGENT